MYSWYNFFVRRKRKKEVKPKYNKVPTQDKSGDTQEQPKEELAKHGHREAQGEGDSTLEMGPRAWPYHSPAGPPFLRASVCTPALCGGGETEGRSPDSDEGLPTVQAPTPLRPHLQLHTHWVGSKSPATQVQGGPDCQVHCLLGAQALPSQALPESAPLGPQSPPTAIWGSEAPSFPQPRHRPLSPSGTGLSFPGVERCKVSTGPIF